MLSTSTAPGKVVEGHCSWAPFHHSIHLARVDPQVTERGAACWLLGCPSRLTERPARLFFVLPVASLLCCSFFSSLLVSSLLFSRFVSCLAFSSPLLAYSFLFSSLRFSSFLFSRLVLCRLPTSLPLTQPKSYPKPKLSKSTDRLSQTVR